MGAMRESQVRLTGTMFCNEDVRSYEDREAFQNLMSMREMTSGGIHGERCSHSTEEAASRVDTDICGMDLWSLGGGLSGSYMRIAPLCSLWRM